jgi:peptidoglycan hydrolase-like protein with peptidoglycan-binding domain
VEFAAGLQRFQRAAPLLALQRRAGNAAVGRQLRRTARKLLARYEAGEHALFGGPGKTLKVGGVEITEGELTAMGDFYRDAGAMTGDAAAHKAQFEKLLADIRTDRTMRATSKDGVAEDVWVADTAHRPKGDRYLDLAGANLAHFSPGKSGPDHKKAWQEIHKQALDIAHRAAVGDKQVPDEARVVNAFASHFLTDAFAAGHLAAKQELMDTARQKFDAMKVKGTFKKENAFSEALARGMLANKTIAAEFARRQLRLKTWMSWGNFTREDTSVLIFGLREEEPEMFFSLFARTVHDVLDDAIEKGPAAGLEVTNDNGDVWTLSGDATLRLSPDTLAIGGKAVQAARDNLATAAATPGPLDYEALFRAVWRFVPRPTTQAEHDAAVAKKAKLDVPPPPEPPRLKAARWGTPPNPTLVAAFEDRGRVKQRDPDHDAVTRIQQALLDVTAITGKRYELGPRGVDGDYGPMTAAAVRKFKQDEKLGSEQFGDVGPGTISHLDDLFMGAAPKPPPGPTLKPGAQPGEAQRDAAVRTYTDPGNQLTIDAIVRLAEAKLPTLIAKLEEKKLTRLRPP